MLPKLESHRGSSMEFSSGTRVDIRKRWEEELEEEVERRVERKHSSNQTQVRMHGWRGMTHRARLEPQVRCMNACMTTHLNAAHRAQWCAVVTFVWVMALMQLFAMCSKMFKLCVRMYAVCRSHLCIVNCSWIRGAGYIPFTLSANSINIFSANLSQIPCGLSPFIEYLFFSEPGPMNDHCPLPNFLTYKDTSRVFARLSCSLSLVPQEMSLKHRHKNKIKFFLWNFLMFPLICSANFWLCRRPATYQILGRCSTRISSASIDSVKVSVALRRCNPFCPFLPSFVRFRILMESSKDTITEYEKTWTFVRWRLMILSSPINDRYVHEFFPNQSFPNLRYHLVLSPILLICRTFSSVRDLWYSQWNSDCLGNSSPWISLIPLSQP